MDQDTLVSGGQALVRAMDDDGLSPRLAMWVHDTDVDSWKLWLVPPKEAHDKVDFYRRLSRILSGDAPRFKGLSAADTQFVQDSHPAVKGMLRVFKADGLSAIRFNGNMFDGYYLPEGVVLRSHG